jgi:acyl-CoA thioesterase
MRPRRGDGVPAADPMPFEFDEDTRVEALAPGSYAARLTDRWGIGAVPNGGYVLAVAMRALGQALPPPDPLTVTAHYLRPARPGAARIAVEVVKQGRRFATGVARLEQEAGEVVRVLATYGDLAADAEPLYSAIAPPAMPPRSGGIARSGDAATEILRRFDWRLDPATAGFQRGAPTGRAEIRGWIRFADGRMPDTHALGLFADAFPPAVFQVLGPGWVPTLELTVHVRARPASEWLACAFRTRLVQGGLLDEAGEIWDESGRLVAESRQLAAVPRAPRKG